MTYRQFINLSETDQELVIWFRGVQIAARENQRYNYTLYQLDGFYIEMVYILPFNILKSFRPFEDVNKLDDYLDDINIDSISAYILQKRK